MIFEFRGLSEIDRFVMMDAVPHKDIEFGPLDRSHEDLCRQIRKICKIMIPEWSDIDDESGFEVCRWLYWVSAVIAC